MNNTWFTTNNTYGSFYNNMYRRFTIPRMVNTTYISRSGPFTTYPTFRSTIPSARTSNGLTIKRLNEVSELTVNEVEDTCVICQDKIEVNSVIRKLNCNHKYHYKCIDNWFENNYTCPLCMKRF